MTLTSWYQVQVGTIDNSTVNKKNTDNIIYIIHQLLLFPRWSYPVLKMKQQVNKQKETNFNHCH